MNKWRDGRLTVSNILLRQQLLLSGVIELLQKINLCSLHVFIYACLYKYGLMYVCLEKHGRELNRWNTGWAFTFINYLNIFIYYRYLGIKEFWSI